MERAAVSVLFVERDRLAKDGEGVGDIAGEDRDGVERAAGGDDAGGGESPERRLQPDNAVERRRHAPRSRRVGAKRERNEARADRGRRAGARPARNEIRAQRIARNAVGRAYADEPGGELIEVGLADDDCASALEPLDDERRTAGAIGESRTGRRRRQAGDIDIVLDDERDAVERLARGS